METMSVSKTAKGLCKICPPLWPYSPLGSRFLQAEVVHVPMLPAAPQRRFNKQLLIQPLIKAALGCQDTSVVALWRAGGLACWSVAAPRQGRLHNWNVLSPSLIKIRTSLIGRQRLCSLHGNQEGAERALNVNFLCSLHLGVGDQKGKGRKAEGHNTLYTRSSYLVAISFKCPEVKLKGHRIWSQVTWFMFLNLFLTS